MTAPGDRPRLAMLVLVAHVALLVGGVAYAWNEVSGLAAQRGVVDQMRETVAQLDKRLAAGGAQAVAARRPVDLLLPGGSAAVAGANLQDRIVSAIRTAGGTVTSSQLDTGPHETEGSPTPPPVILLTVTCLLGNAALQTLLYTLESGVPAVFFDQISIETASRAGGDPGPGGGNEPLKITMTVSAYWTGEGKS